MFVRLTFISLFISAFLLFAPKSKSAVILKTKSDLALIDLQGLKTQKGSYFSAVDRYGNKKGILQIQKVGKKKALGVLTGGRMAKSWSLKPTSEKKALLAQMNFERRLKKTAKLKAKKLERQVRLAKRKQKLLRRRLAMQEKKRQVEKRRMRRYKKRLALNRERRELERRGIASFPEGEEDVAEESENEWGAPELSSLDYGLDFSTEGQKGISQREEEEDLSSADTNLSDVKSSSVSLAPFFDYNFLKASLKNEEGFLMLGLGGGLRAGLDFYLNSFLRAESSVGFRRFAVSSEDENCSDWDKCFLQINYFSAGLNLKLNTGQIGKNRIWLSANGELMYAFGKSNKSPIDDISFDPPIHGTFGAGIGLDIHLSDDFFMPITIKGDIYMPPSASILNGSGGIQIGLSYSL